MNAAFVVVVLYIALMFAISFALTKRSKSTHELFVAKKELGIVLLVPLIFGEVIAASSTVGTAQGGYTQGISAIWTFVGKGLGSIVFAFLLVKFFDAAGKAGVMSVPEAFKWRFDNRIRILMLVVFIIPIGLMCAVQCRALASLVGPMIGVDIDTLIVIAGVCFGILALSGIKGIARINVVNAFVIIAGIVVACAACVVSQGGLAELFAKMPQGYDNLVYPSFGEIGGQFISATLAFCVTVTPTNACFSTGSPKTSRRALVITGILTCVFAFFPALIGMCGAVALPGIDPNTVLYAMPASISPALSTMVCMAVLAAVVSTAPFFFLSFSTVFVRDIALQLKPGMSQGAQMKVAVAATALYTVFVIFLSFHTSSIFSQVIGANHIKAAAGFLILVALVSKKLTNTAAFWSLLISGGLSIYWYFSGSVFGLDVDPLWPALAIAAALMIVISFLDKGHSGSDYQSFSERRALALGSDGMDSPSSSVSRVLRESAAGDNKQ